MSVASTTFIRLDEDSEIQMNWPSGLRLKLKVQIYSLLVAIARTRTM